MDSKTKTKHTPGPWAAGNRGWVDSEDAPIAAVMDYDEQGAANVLLIAAAPDLLAALVDAKAALEYAGMDEYTMEAYDRICAAINKATGEGE